MRILITGGSGFLGSPLRGHRAGHEVRTLGGEVDPISIGYRLAENLSFEGEFFAGASSRKRSRMIGKKNAMVGCQTLPAIPSSQWQLL